MTGWIMTLRSLCIRSTSLAVMCAGAVGFMKRQQTARIQFSEVFDRFQYRGSSLPACFFFRLMGIAFVCLRSFFQTLSRYALGRIICGVFFCFLINTASAGDIVARNPVLEPDGDGYVLSADFDLNFNPRLEEAVNKGVTLSFVIDFELIRPRWYWFDDEAVKVSKPIQLSYHALTRQYRLSSGGLSQGFSSLDSALRVMSRLRHWRVLDNAMIGAGRTYQAAVRMRFDLAQLPKTFQVNALSNRDWNMTSEWVRWPFTSAVPKPVEDSPALPEEEPAKSEGEHAVSEEAPTPSTGDAQ